MTASPSSEPEELEQEEQEEQEDEAGLAHLGTLEQRRRQTEASFYAGRRRGTERGAEVCGGHLHHLEPLTSSLYETLSDSGVGEWDETTLLEELHSNVYTFYTVPGTIYVNETGTQTKVF